MRHARSYKGNLTSLYAVCSELLALVHTLLMTNPGGQILRPTMSKLGACSGWLLFVFSNLRLNFLQRLFC